MEHHGSKNWRNMLSHIIMKSRVNVVHKTVALFVNYTVHNFSWVHVEMSSYVPSILFSMMFHNHNVDNNFVAHREQNSCVILNSLLYYRYNGTVYKHIWLLNVDNHNWLHYASVSWVFSVLFPTILYDHNVDNHILVHLQ